MTHLCVVALLVSLKSTTRMSDADVEDDAVVRAMIARAVVFIIQLCAG